VQIYGANTDVGKTVFSTLLGRRFVKYKKDWLIQYIKPVSTGPQSDRDDESVNLFLTARKALTKPAT
jgi:dethiobiotin synthetase/adenosylmethionine--8-amino-7-oxononanoate aminotransferase